MSEPTTQDIGLPAGLGEVERRVRALFAQRRVNDPAPDDPFRGLYLSDAVVTWILDRRASTMDVSARLSTMVDTFELSELDVQLLLIALAPDLDDRFERCYGYLNDDVGRRRATIGLAMTLCELSMADPAGRARLAAGGPLVDGGLLLIEDGDAPFPGRVLRVPDRVCAHLLGDDTPAAELGEVLLAPPRTAVDPEPLAGGLRRGLRRCYLRGSGGLSFAVAALHAAGFAALPVDLDRLETGGDPRGLARVLAREAKLIDAGVVVTGVDERHRSMLRVLCELDVPVLLTGSAAWHPDWAQQQPLPVEVPAARPGDRDALWRAELNGSLGVSAPAAATEGFRLNPEQITSAAQAARGFAALAGTQVTGTELRAGARAQNSAGLERLARRIVPSVGWADLVLPEGPLRQLQGLAVRARHRERVLGEWAMRPGGGRGCGVTALFTGESGTGKTTAAEVVAADLGLDLYTVELSTVVDKYIGETEKNLDRIFTEAARVNGVLLFDEADAIFGKRSAVSDAHDRYANIESAYLLQRMESFDGLAILATNLRANLDEAFTRRLDLLVDFPVPDEQLRRSLWDTCLGTLLPRAADLDLGYCARVFDLAGGDIRSAVVSAAYSAAAQDRPVSQADLVAAAQEEYRKLGRLRMPARL